MTLRAMALMPRAFRPRARQAAESAAVTFRLGAPRARAANLRQQVGLQAFPPLSRAGVTQMTAGTGIDPDELYRLTNGNPFFISEVIASQPEGLPASARDAVRVCSTTQVTGISAGRFPPRRRR